MAVSLTRLGALCGWLPSAVVGDDAWVRLCCVAWEVVAASVACARNPVSDLRMKRPVSALVDTCTLAICVAVVSADFDLAAARRAAAVARLPRGARDVVLVAICSLGMIAFAYSHQRLW